MTRLLSIGSAVTVIAMAAGCSGSSVQNSILPSTTSTNPLTSSTLQFAAGTANIAGVVGLNTVVTLRQNSGSAAGTSVLSNAPTITGPAGFVVPALAAAPDAYGDAGTNHISAFIPTSLASPPPLTTFDPNGTGTSNAGTAQGNYLASSWGFFPGVVGISGLSPSLTPGPMPFYSANNDVLMGTPLEYIGGPPAFVPSGHTSTQDGTFPSGYGGYTLGITDFQTAPVSGSYALSVVIPTGLNSTTGASSYGTKATAATISAATVLPAWATAPTFAPDGTGGGTITTNFAGGGGVTEEFIELVNVGVVTGGSQVGNTCQGSGAGPYYYTFEVPLGAATVAVPDDIGAARPGTTQPHTFCTAAENSAADGAATAQDGWMVYGFAVDYPLLEAGFPASTGVAAPKITSSGQDDLTSSMASTGPAAGTASSVRAMAKWIQSQRQQHR